MSPTGPTRAAAQRRAVPTLVATQALGGVGISSGIAVGGLLGQDLSGSTALAGLTQTATVLGAAVLAVPLARFAQRRGRRPALTTGYAVGLAGALLIIASAVTSQFALLLLGSLLFGGASAAGLQARYAATDAALPEARGRALSVVVWATTVGVVAGPNLSGVGGDLGRALGLPVLAGPYVFSLAAFAAAGLLVLVRLRPDPLQVAGHDAPRDVARPTVRQALHAVAVVPPALLGLTTMCAAHAVMVGVMVMTPVHLVHGGASLQVVGLVISAHVFGMYAASPLFGWLADHVGRVPTVLLGVGLLAASLLTAGTSGDAHSQNGAGLLLLGLGWSACLVAGSTLISESVPEALRTSVQGASDLLMGLAGATAGALAGGVLNLLGYGGLTAVAAALLIPVVSLLLRPRVAAPA